MTGKRESLHQFLEKTKNKTSNTIVQSLCGKISERIIYDNMLNYFLDNNLISPKYSGFRSGDSCINQLL